MVERSAKLSKHVCSIKTSYTHRQINRFYEVSTSHVSEASGINKTRMQKVLQKASHRKERIKMTQGRVNNQPKFAWGRMQHDVALIEVQTIPLSHSYVATVAAYRSRINLSCNHNKINERARYIYQFVIYIRQLAMQLRSYQTNSLYKRSVL